MQRKLEILEALRTNVINTRDSDAISNELTRELVRIESDLDEAINTEKQIILLDQEIREIELQKKLDEAFAKDDSHTKRLSQN